MTTSPSTPALEPSPAITTPPLPAATTSPIDSTPVDGQLAGIDWGSLAEWVAAIAAVIAVIAAARSLYYSRKAVDASNQANKITADAYRADVKARREAQARFVYATTDVPQVRPEGGPFVVFVGVAVHNNSEEIVGPFRLSLHDKVTKKPIGGALIEDEPLLPGKSYSTEFTVRITEDESDPYPRPRATLVFRDSAGQWWERRDYEPIEELQGAPLW
jgi:hypothetical protein